MVEDSKRSVLLFEPEHSGHQMEYLLLFSKRILQEDISWLIFVIPAALLEKLQADLAWREIEQRACVQVLVFTDAELERCNASNLFVRSFWLWKMVSKYARDTKVSDVVSMRIDHFQLALALGLPLPVRLTGILFQPSLHYEELDMLGKDCLTWRGRVKALRQKILYARMLKHTCMHALFTLDDSFSAWGKKKFSCGDKIHFLPDPSHPEVTRITDVSMHGLIGDVGERTVFLLFGALSRRKGIFKLLSAMLLLSQEERDKLCVVFAGKVAGEDQEEFLSQVPALRELDPDCCTVINRFLSTDEIKTLIVHCDVVLACYQNVVGSSGILLWAASAEKPVIAQQ